MQCLYHLSSQAGSYCQGENISANNGTRVPTALGLPSQESQGILPEI